MNKKDLQALMDADCLFCHRCGTIYTPYDFPSTIGVLKECHYCHGSGLFYVIGSPQHVIEWVPTLPEEETR